VEKTYSQFVVDAVSGLPVENAVVSIVKGCVPDKSVTSDTTDVNGEWEIQTSNICSHTLQVAADGYGIKLVDGENYIAGGTIEIEEAERKITLNVANADNIADCSASFWYGTGNNPEKVLEKELTSSPIDFYFAANTLVDFVSVDCGANYLTNGTEVPSTVNTFSLSMEKTKIIDFNLSKPEITDDSSSFKVSFTGNNLDLLTVKAVDEAYTDIEAEIVSTAGSIEVSTAVDKQFIVMLYNDDKLIFSDLYYPSASGASNDKGSRATLEFDPAKGGQLRAEQTGGGDDGLGEYSDDAPVMSMEIKPGDVETNSPEINSCTDLQSLMNMGVVSPVTSSDDLVISYENLYEYNVTMSCDGELIQPEVINSVIKEFIITLPFDPTLVNQGDIESGDYTVIYAETFADYQAGNYEQIAPEDILDIDYANGQIRFKVEHLTLFGVSEDDYVAPSDPAEPVSEGGSSSGDFLIGGCSAGGSNNILYIIALLSGVLLVRSFRGRNKDLSE
jgi:hypothetical protein